MNFFGMCATFAKGVFLLTTATHAAHYHHSAGYFFRYRDSLRLPQLSA